MTLLQNYYNITVADLKSNKRNADIANPRQVSMYLMRNMIEKENSLKTIGIILGGKDDSTVKYGIEKIESEMKKDGLLPIRSILLRRRSIRHNVNNLWDNMWIKLG